MTIKRGITVNINVKLTPDMKKRLIDYAKELGVNFNISIIVRKAIQEYLDKNEVE